MYNQSGGVDSGRSGALMPKYSLDIGAPDDKLWGRKLVSKEEGSLLNPFVYDLQYVGYCIQVACKRAIDVASLDGILAENLVGCIAFISKDLNTFDTNESAIPVVAIKGGGYLSLPNRFDFAIFGTFLTFAVQHKNRFTLQNGRILPIVPYRMYKTAAEKAKFQMLQNNVVPVGISTGKNAVISQSKQPVRMIFDFEQMKQQKFDNLSEVPPLSFSAARVNIPKISGSQSIITANKAQKQEMVTANMEFLKLAHGLLVTDKETPFNTMVQDSKDNNNHLSSGTINTNTTTTPALYKEVTCNVCKKLQIEGKENFVPALVRDDNSHSPALFASVRLCKKCDSDRKNSNTLADAPIEKAKRQRTSKKEKATDSKAKRRKTASNKDNIDNAQTNTSLHVTEKSPIIATEPAKQVILPELLSLTTNHTMISASTSESTPLTATGASNLNTLNSNNNNNNNRKVNGRNKTPHNRTNIIHFMKEIVQDSRFNLWASERNIFSNVPVEIGRSPSEEALKQLAICTCFCATYFSKELKEIFSEKKQDPLSVIFE